MPEGQFKVDDYKTTGWDPYIQEANLRRAFADVHTESGAFGLVLGRFFVPQGLPLEESRWFTSKDLTHIELINAATDQGAEAYWRFGTEEGRHGRLSAAVISGNGNPYHDYVYFDFTRSAQEDTNSAVGMVGALRVWPAARPRRPLHLQVQLRGLAHRVRPLLCSARSTTTTPSPLACAIGRRSSSTSSCSASTRATSGACATPRPSCCPSPASRPSTRTASTSASICPHPSPRLKGQLGVVAVREDLDRDDSLVATLAAEGRFGVKLGEKERTTIVKVYAEFGPLTAFFFYNDLDNPFPAASAIVPISGPFAFTRPGQLEDRFRGTAQEGLLGESPESLRHEPGLMTM